MYRVNKADLIGDIKDFPIEVVQKMIDNQVEQGNIANVKIFQKKKIASKKDGGMFWSDTIEGHCFWDSVIQDKIFEIFFKKYPKKDIDIITLGKHKKHLVLNFNL